MLNGQHTGNSDHPVGARILQHGPFVAHEMIFTPDRIREFWARIQRFPTLFTDTTRGKPENLWTIVSRIDSTWVEVWEYRSDGSGVDWVGVLYLTDIQPGIDASVHVIFFDFKSMRKYDGLCLAMLRWAKKRFVLHRYTACVPTIYFETRSMLKRLGFKQEGRKREAMLMDGKWMHEDIFGLLTKEL